MSFKLFYLSSKHLLRISIPSKLIRYFIISIGSFLMLGGIILGVFFGFHPPPQWQGGFRSVEFLKNLSGLFFFINTLILIIPTLITIRGSLKLLDTDEAVNLINLAPISPVSKFWATIGPIIFFSSIPYFILLSPFIVLFLFLDPLISFATILYFIVVSGWSTVLSFVTIVVLIDFFGKKSASRLSYAFPFVLYLISASFIYAAEDIRIFAPVIGYWQLIFLAVSIILLPPLFKEATRSFYNHLVSSFEQIKEYAPPKWGNYNPWDYIDRETSNWSMLPLIIFIGVMISRVYEIPGLNEGFLSLLLFSFVTNPTNMIMQAERKNPMRWALAPFAERIKKLIWLKVNLPLFLLGLITVIYFGYENLLWMSSNLALLVLGLVIIMDDWVNQMTILKRVLYNLLLVACLFTQLTW